MSAKKKSSGARAPRQRESAPQETTTPLERVRDGVRRFILNDVSIGDFHKALRTAVRKGELSPNPLTGPAFRKIVKQVMNEHKPTATKP